MKRRMFGLTLVYLCCAIGFASTSRADTTAASASAPLPQTFFAETTVDVPVEIRLDAKSGDARPLKFSITRPPAAGSLSLDGSVATYTPRPGFIGLDEFHYAVSDGRRHASAPVQVLVARPAPGALDRGFGVAGLATTSFSRPASCDAAALQRGDEADRLLIQRDDRIVSVGWRRTSPEDPDRRELLVARHDARGFPDSGFGQDGIMRLAIHAESGRVAAAGELADGSLLVLIQLESAETGRGGLSGAHLVELDASTGEPIEIRGHRMLPLPAPFEASAMVIQRDGRVLLADGLRPAFIRLTKELEIDRSYGDAGLHQIALPRSGGHERRGAGIIDMHALSDGRIQFVGHGNSELGPAEDRKQSDWILGRLLEDGTLDETFWRGEGVRYADFAQVERPKNVFTGASGEVIGAGHLGDDLGNDSRSFVFARFDRDGQLDRGFGDEGLQITGIDGPVVFPNRVVADRRGGYVGAGNVSGVIAVQRFDREGRLDRSFGTMGQAVGHRAPSWQREGSLEYWQSHHTRTADAAIQSDGRIVALGTAVSCSGAAATGRDFVLIRFWN